MPDDKVVKKVFQEKRWKTKIKVVKLYWEWSEIDGCQEMVEEIGTQICTTYHSEGDIVEL